MEAACLVKYYYEVFVDGIRVARFWLDRGESKCVLFPSDMGCQMSVVVVVVTE